MKMNLKDDNDVRRVVKELVGDELGLQSLCEAYAQLGENLKSEYTPQTVANILTNWCTEADLIEGHSNSIYTALTGHSLFEVVQIGNELYEKHLEEQVEEKQRNREKYEALFNAMFDPEDYSMDQIVLYACSKLMHCIHGTTRELITHLHDIMALIIYGDDDVVYATETLFKIFSGMDIYEFMDSLINYPDWLNKVMPSRFPSPETKAEKTKRVEDSDIDIFNALIDSMKALHEIDKK